MLNIVESIDNDWSVIDVAVKRTPPNWKDVFQSSELELKDVSDILETDKKINGRFYPDMKNLFRIFDLVPLTRVKVVIIDQDPYHSADADGHPTAQGMAFSVRKGAGIPPSLVNIYKELKNTVPEFNTPSHGDLTRWALQGVFLLNSCLTVRPGSAGSHKEIWLGFIKKVINAIIDQNPNCIFVVWGLKAQKIRKMIGERVTVLESAHPSPLSAYRGFFGCNHFNEINRLLAERGQNPIDWNV